MRGENRGIVSLAAVMALLLGVAPILLGVGRAPSALDTLRSTAWFGTSGGSLVQVNGLNGEQLFSLDDLGGPRATVREDGSVVYVLDDGRVRVVDGSSRRQLPVDGAPAGDQLLVNDRAVWVVDSEEGALAWAGPVRPRAGARVRFRPGEGGEPTLGRAGLDPTGVLWAPDARGRIRRVVRAVPAATIPVPGSGPLHAVVVGTRPVALRTGPGQARVIRRGEVGPPLELGVDVNRPLEDQPDGDLFVSRREGQVLKVDLGGGERPVSRDLPGSGRTSAPVVGREAVVVVRGTQVLVLDPDTLEVLAQQDLGDVDPDEITLRTRDGIAYVLDPTSDLGAVVNGTDIFPLDLRPDGSVPSAAVAEPDVEAPALNPPPDGVGPDGRPRPGGPDGLPRGPDGLPRGPDGGRGPTERRPGPVDPRNPTTPNPPQGPRTPRTPTPPETPTCAYDVTSASASPSQPEGLAASVTIDWRQAAVDAGCAADGAAVYAAVVPDGGGAPAGTGPSRPYTTLTGGGRDVIGGIPAGSWRARVAVVRGGQEIDAVESAPFTVASPEPQAPGPPGPLQVAAGDRELTVSWSPPAGGADEYRVVVVGASEQVVGGTQARLTGLQNGVTYTVLVYSRRGGREGPTPSQGSGTPRPPEVTTTGFTVGPPGFGPDANDAVLLVTVARSDGSTPSSCRVRYQGQRGGDTAEVTLQPCRRLVVGVYGSVYDVTLLAVDGRSESGWSARAETNRVSSYTSPGGLLDYTDRNGNPGQVQLPPDSNHLIECRVGGELVAYGGVIPAGARFVRPGFMERPPHEAKIPPCGT